MMLTSVLDQSYNCWLRLLPQPCCGLRRNEVVEASIGDFKRLERQHTFRGAKTGHL